MSKLLVIDDEETNVRLLSMSLRSDGYHVFTATSGKEGLDIFRQELPDIVLTDIRMPGMDGIEVLKRIKSMKTDSEVIIVTGHGDIDNAIEALKYGASDFINKPIRDDVLSIAIQRAEEKLETNHKLKNYTINLEKEVKKSTEELRRRSSFMVKLIRSSHDGIVATDSTFKIVIFNPSAEKIFGYLREEIRNKVNVYDLYPTDVSESFIEREMENRSLGELQWKETLITHRDGTKIPVKFSGTMLHEKKQVMGSVAFFQDLREIKRLERELVRSERLAAIGQTVAGMAHGVKNILHGFKGGRYLVDLGIKKNDSEKLTQGWELIKKNIDRTSQLVLDLLSYSKEREPEFEPCSPNAIANDVCELMRETAAEHQVEIKKELDPSLGMAMMDPRALHAALLNLMSNGVDACLFDEMKGKQWQVSMKTMLENGTILFKIADNGAGMDKEVQAKLFTSFFSTKGHRGTGLGLLVTRKLIEEHNGKIEVDSEPGKGTCFTIRLPYEPAKKKI